MNRAAFRGQPLLLLGGVLLGWSCLRIAMWQTSWAQPLLAHAPGAVPAPERGAAAKSRRLAATFGIPARPSRPMALPLSTGLSRLRAPPSPPPVVVDISDARLVSADAGPRPRLSPGVPSAAPPGVATPPRRPGTNDASRWSVDGWLLLRGDGAAAVAAGRPSYGRSQAGAVLRLNLAPASDLRPRAYLRASAALAGAREQHLAAGLSVRPLRGVPIRIAAEARVTETDFGVSLRPAVYAVTELPPVALPYGTRGEAYVQGGYVAGSFATGFVDGQARLDRPIAQVAGTEISAGASIAGGAQEGAARVDIGPAVSAIFRLGGARGRVTAEYRFRVAGDAAPASGPALTLSAGF